MEVFHQFSFEQFCDHVCNSNCRKTNSFISIHLLYDKILIHYKRKIYAYIHGITWHTHWKLLEKSTMQKAAKKINRVCRLEMKPIPILPDTESTANIAISVTSDIYTFLHSFLSFPAHYLSFDVNLISCKETFLRFTHRRKYYTRKLSQTTILTILKFTKWFIIVARIWRRVFD